MKGNRNSAAALILMTVVGSLVVGGPRPCGATHPSAVARSKSGMVVTASPRATEVGRDVLARGGNAVDAAVAVGFALAVTFPEAGNIGGGGFMLVRTAQGEESFIDFRETAPAAAHRSMYLDDGGTVIAGASTVGHRAVGVPGTVAGLYEALRRFGSMPWSELIEPAVILALEGFPIDARLAFSLKRLRRDYERFPGLGAFFGDGGEPLREGEMLRQPELAAVLKRIAVSGPADFYRGQTAGLIVAEMAAGGGYITREDLAAYRAVPREPVRGTYRAFELISAPPPSSGGIALLEILNVVEGFPLADYGHLSDEYVHALVEAEKRAFADRARYLGDPDFVEIPVMTLISKEYAIHLRSSITSAATRAERLAGGLEGYEHSETTHYSIVDRLGNAVATTTTLNGAYGSKVVVGGGGFLLNNEMDDFSVKPGTPNMYGLTGASANAIEPGKRMLSSMAPTIVLRDGVVRLVLGTPGGSTIITTVAQVIIGLLDIGLSPDAAVAAPRFHHQWLPDTIRCESGALGAELRRRLAERGHVSAEISGAIGDVQLILMEEDSTACGVSDPRGGGEALGCDRALSRE